MDSLPAQPGMPPALTRDGNTVFNSDSGTCAAASAGQLHRPIFLEQSLSRRCGSDPFTTPPPGLANNLGTTINTVLRSQRTPTIYNFNFARGVRAAASGRRDCWLRRQPGPFPATFACVDLNQLDLGTIAKYGAALCVDPSNLAARWCPTLGADSARDQRERRSQPRFPCGWRSSSTRNLAMAAMAAAMALSLTGYPAGDSEYSSLQTKVQKRLTATSPRSPLLPGEK